MIKVTLAISTYNRAWSIERCLASALNQTLDKTRLEILVVDDASTDETASIVDTWRQAWPQIRLERLPKNSGSPSVPRNVAIELARGELLIFLDSDDQMLPDACRSLAACADAAEADFVRACYETVRGGVLAGRNALDAHRCVDRQGLVLEMLQKQSWTSLITAYRTSFLRSKDIRFVPGMRTAEDIAFLSECLKATERTAYLDEPVQRVFVPEAASGQNLSTQILVDDWLKAWSIIIPNLKAIGFDYLQTLAPLNVGHLMVLIRAGALLSPSDKQKLVHGLRHIGVTDTLPIREDLRPVLRSLLAEPPSHDTERLA